MSFNYKEVVPWGRNFDEYRRMFSLSDADLKKKILGCGDGPASFNAECNAIGGNVISVDPIYSMEKELIKKRIEETFEIVISQTRNNTGKFKWDKIRSVDELGKIRIEAMSRFLSSYENGKREGLYVEGSLPRLPFNDDSFDIALSSHFLFLYSSNLGYDFHLKSIQEMLRVAGEVRIFPLLDFNALKSPFVERIAEDLSGYRIEITKVDYEFQIEGNEVMIISKITENQKV